MKLTKFFTAVLMLTVFCISLTTFLWTQPQPDWRDKIEEGGAIFGDFRYKEEAGTIKILRYEGKGTEVIIPESVKLIESGAFARNQLIKINIGADVNLDILAFEYSSDTSFTSFYLKNGKLAGIYTRPNADSKVWTRE